MKTICFFSGDITRCGGTEKVSSMIASMIKRQGKHRVIFLSLMEAEQAPFFKLEKGIERYRLGEKWISPGPGYIKLIPKLREFLKEQDVDIIIDIDIVLDSLSIPATKKLKTKVISWEHFPYQFEESVMYRRLIRKYSVKHSDYVVTLTERDKELYGKCLKRKENIRAIYNPMEEAVLHPDVRKEKWIITVGALIHVKGMDYLMEVAKNILKRHKDWKWILLGEGQMRPFLEEGIRNEHLEDQLLLKGNVTNVGEYLQRAQIFVMTSRSEGLPMCMLEAKAYGLPCVAFDTKTGLEELIEDQINGFLAADFSCTEMEEKIERLIESEDLRRRFSEKSMLGTDRFQADYILEQWNQVIDEICG